MVDMFDRRVQEKWNIQAIKDFSQSIGKMVRPTCQLKVPSKQWEMITYCMYSLKTLSE